MSKQTENKKNELSIFADKLIVLAVLSAVSIYYYGARAAIVIVLSALVCCVTDLICIKLRKKKADIKDLSALITGIIIALMMPASVPYYVVITADIFAVILAKQAFGGHGHEIFSPSAAGFLFAALCFPEAVLYYPKPFTSLPLSSVTGTEIQLSQSAAKAIISTGTTDVSVMDLLIGKFCGPMGTGFVLILLISAVFLMFRRSISAITFFTQLVIISGFSYIYCGFDIMDTVRLICSGMFIFGMTFLSGDFTTIPKTHSSRFLYGLITGCIILLFRFYTKSEISVICAIIISAPIGIELDRLMISFAGKKAKNKKSLPDNSDDTIIMISGSDINDSESSTAVGKKSEP